MSARAGFALLIGLAGVFATAPATAQPSPAEHAVEAPARQHVASSPRGSRNSPNLRLVAGISQSQAVRVALGCAQGGEPLKVHRQGDGYSVTVLKGSQVRVVRVDSAGSCR